jgi:hypothetical protein
VTELVRDGRGPARQLQPADRASGGDSRFAQTPFLAQPQPGLAGVRVPSLLSQVTVDRLDGLSPDPDQAGSATFAPDHNGRLVEIHIGGKWVIGDGVGLDGGVDVFSPRRCRRQEGSSPARSPTVGPLLAA